MRNISKKYNKNVAYSNNFAYITNLTNNKIKNKKLSNNIYGYNLITLSMVVLIMGVIMTALIGYYDALNINRRTTMTEDKFKIINTSLVAYLAKNGKFPCPAPLDCDLQGCNNDSVFTEKVLGIEFRQDRDIDNDCIADNSGVFESKNEKGEKILYGNVPALSLGLDNNYLIDSWQNKIVYIIPDILTKDNSLKNILLNKDARDPTISDEYVKDGEIFLLLSNNVNTSGAFPYENRESNDFSSLISSSHNEDKYNLPQKDFTIDLENAKQLKFHTNIDNLHEAIKKDHIDKNDIGAPDCAETTETVLLIDDTGNSSEPDSIPYVDKYNNDPTTQWKEDSTTVKKYRAIPFKIPDYVTEVYIALWGAQGGGHDCAGKGDGLTEGMLGGGGGNTYGFLDTTDENLEKIGVKDRTIYFYIGGRGKNVAGNTGGGGGWNGGGGAATGTKSSVKEGAGGGATDVRTSANLSNLADWKSTLSSRLMVAGGGGGSSVGGEVYSQEKGGAGGGGNNNGLNGGSHNKKTPGYGGCAIGNSDRCCKINPATIGNNGGGGGYYAGGGGGCSAESGGNYAGGGGGSGYINDSIISDRKTPLSVKEVNVNTEKGGKSNAFYRRDKCAKKGDKGPSTAKNGQALIIFIGVKNDKKEEPFTYYYTFTFKQAKAGEVRFADETCPSNVSNPVQKNDFYTVSTHNAASKPAKKCGNNQQWEQNFEYTCKVLPKCENPVKKFPGVDWGNINYDIVNTGIITGTDNTTNTIVKYKCIVELDEYGNYTTSYIRL